MELKITRLPYDDPHYAIHSGEGSRFFNASGLKQWLIELGIGDATVAAVLDMGPNETLTIKAGEKVA